MNKQKLINACINYTTMNFLLVDKQDIMVIDHMDALRSRVTTYPRVNL